MTAQKYLYNNAGQVTEKVATVTSSGSANGGQIVALTTAGLLDTSVMPVGIGADTSAIVASEALAAGAFVNIWNNSSVANVRNADGSTSGKEAHGFVLAAVSSSATATVYMTGTNTQVTGATAGVVFLSAVTPGASVSAAPTGSGQTVQRLGVATSATSIDFGRQTPIVLA